VQHQLRAHENLIDQRRAEGTRAGARRPGLPKAGGRALSPARGAAQRRRLDPQRLDSAT
jgi:hypothetical protein